MPITPYSAPLQYEYKPLNLMAFAAPLSKMQEDFDITTDAVESSDFDLQHLSLGTDPEKAKALIEVARKKRDELAASLAETKNYKQAATKLKQLNTAWKKDPEAIALQANYAAYADMQKTSEENVKSGYWTQEKANEWMARAKREYKGAEFTADANNPTGTYTPYGLNPRGKDLDKEFEELVWKVANALPEHKYDAFASAGIDPDTMDKEFIKTIVAVKDPNVAASKISAYLRTLPRFKQYFQENADYSFDALKNDPRNADQYKELAANLNDQLLNSVNAELVGYEKAAKKDPSILQDAKYLELLDYKTRAIASKETGEYDDELTKSLYFQDQLNDRYNMQSVGNVIGYKNVTHDYTFRKLDDGDGNGNGNGNKDGTNPFLVPAEDMKFNVFSIRDDIKSARTNLKGVVSAIDKISGGTLGAVILGSEGSDRRKRIINNNAAIYESQVILRDALVTSKNITEFREKLKDGGMNPPLRYVERLYKDLKSPNSVGLQELNSGIAKGEVHYNSGVSAQQNYELLQSSAYSDPDIKKVLDEVGTKNPLAFSGDFGDWGDWGGLNEGQQKEIGQIQHVFGSRSYSAERLKKAGINTSDNRAMSDLVTGGKGVILTYDEVAKLHGYKNFRDAIIKGYDFGGVAIGTDYKLGVNGELDKSMFSKFNLGNNATQIQQNLLSWSGKKGLEVNKMTYDLVNDQRSQTELGQIFSTVDKVISYAGTESYAGMPGFDKNGNPLPGTKITVGGNKQPMLTLHGSQVYVRVPYSYEGGQGMITIKPKVGTEDYIYSILDRVDKSTAGSTNPLEQQTNESIRNAKFTQVYGNTINDVRANSPAFQVTLAHPERTLGDIIIADPFGNPTSVKIVKILPINEGGGAQPYYSVKYDDGTYKGRSNDVNGIRAAIMLGL